MIAHLHGGRSDGTTMTILHELSEIFVPVQIPSERLMDELDLDPTRVESRALVYRYTGTVVLDARGEPVGRHYEFAGYRR